MQIKFAIGQKIVGVNQEVYYDSHIGQMRTHVTSFQLENGTKLVLNAYETSDAPLVDVLVVRDGKIKR